MAHRWIICCRLAAAALRQGDHSHSIINRCLKAIPGWTTNRFSGIDTMQKTMAIYLLRIEAGIRRNCQTASDDQLTFDGLHQWVPITTLDRQMSMKKDAQ